MVSLSRIICLGLFVAALGLGAASKQDAPKDKAPAERVEAAKPPAKPQANAGDRARPADIRVSPEKPKATEKEAPATKPKGREGLPLGTFADWVIVIFTGALTWVAIKQHTLETKLANDTADALDVARKSAAAAAALARAARDAQRPWVFISDVTQHTHRFRLDENRLVVERFVELKNSGVLPAVDIHLQSMMTSAAEDFSKVLADFFDRALYEERPQDGQDDLFSYLTAQDEGARVKVKFELSMAEIPVNPDGRRQGRPLLAVSVVYRAVNDDRVFQTTLVQRAGEPTTPGSPDMVIKITPDDEIETRDPNVGWRIDRRASLVREREAAQPVDRQAALAGNH